MQFLSILTDIKYLSLLLCVLQNTSLVLLMRYSRTQEGPRYFTSTAVIAAEVVKVLSCWGVMLFTSKGNVSQVLKDSVGEIMDTLKIAIPAGVYAVQNNLLYIGLSNLEAPVYQVANQLKVLTTAVFFAIILDKRLGCQKWVSLLILFCGISMVQLSAMGVSSPKKPDAEQDALLGGLAVLAASITSGFAGVYFEKILKGSTATVWVRNVQLGFFGFIFASIITGLMEYDQLSEKGFFYGWNYIVVLVVINQGMFCIIVVI
eukprot:TRINITY_DN3047_c0_g1_i1.p1 TRINITY_DN3047_c0_g1~~TRINITY_DN3047_c0_g1_i1.p1  ORF type:complete len:261 (+),score=19.65 TRINITY_DN3047_c0_g1_i1:875-1657(+)